MMMTRRSLKNTGTIADAISPEQIHNPIKQTVGLLIRRPHLSTAC